MNQMNPNFATIGETFVNQYYTLFDQGAAQRAGLANFYGEANSLLTFQGEQFMGRVKIMEKIAALTFQTIKHQITTVDCQPTFDGGVVVMVFGQLKTDDDPPLSFSQVFILKPANNAFYVEHDVFRLGLLG